MRIVKYIIVPGWITSTTDGQRHYISAYKLIDLYKVKESECVIAGPTDNVLSQRRITRLLEEHQDAIILAPRNDGRYIL